MRESLTRALGLEGYHVVAVGNGAEALDAAGTKAPDVTVLDVSMPIVDLPSGAVQVAGSLEETDAVLGIFAGGPCSSSVGSPRSPR